MKSLRIKNNKLPLIVIVGPTASGKTAVGIELAKIIDGEIICADSRTVYKGMDIGTAKPTKREQSDIKHWCLDLVQPDENFTVADFQKQAKLAIKNIRSRGKIPIMIGGSGLYVDSVIFDFDFRQQSDPESRKRLEKFNISELQEYCKKHNYSLPENKNNRRHLIRTIETKGIVVKNNRLAEDVIIVGIDVEKTTIKERIGLRIKQMFEQGIVDETKVLYKNYNSTLEAMTANIYQVVKDFINGAMTKEQAIEVAVTRDMKLVKKQRTWFKRNPHIVWLKREQIIDYILNKLD